MTIHEYRQKLIALAVINSKHWFDAFAVGKIIAAPGHGGEVSELADKAARITSELRRTAKLTKTGEK